MKLTVLVDNNTFIDQYYFGEPAAAFYIEEGDARVLLDVGYSHILLPNAEAMGIDLSKLTHIVLSHGHDDHTRGLRFLAQQVDLSDKQLIAHPDTFLPKFNFGRFTGCPYSEAAIADLCRYVPCTEPYAITRRLLFLGHIPRVTDFENKKPVGAVEKDGVRQDDWLTEDSALVYRGERGLFIITGCSHSGICNIIEHAMQVCGDRRILGVLGGFHLFEVNEQTRKTIAYFEERQISLLYPSHCVSLPVRAEMLRTLPVIETGVGMTVELLTHSEIMGRILAIADPNEAFLELARIAAREHLPHDITELVLKAYGDKYRVTVQQMAVRPDGSPVVVPDMPFPNNTIHGIVQHI